MKRTIPQSASNRYKSTVQTIFGGLNANAGAQEGEIVDEENIGSVDYPLLRGTENWGRLHSGESILQYGAADKEWYLKSSGGTVHLVYGGTEDLTPFPGGTERQQVAVMGTMLVFLPEKKIFDTKAFTWTDMEAKESALITGQTWLGLSAHTLYSDRIRILKTNPNASIKIGDGITVSGCRNHNENNKTAILRDKQQVTVTEGGTTVHYVDLVFDDGSFVGNTSFTADDTLNGEYWFYSGAKYIVFTANNLSSGTVITFNGSSLRYTNGGTTAGLAFHSYDSEPGSGTELTFTEGGDPEPVWVQQTMQADIAAGSYYIKEPVRISGSYVPIMLSRTLKAGGTITVYSDIVSSAAIIVDYGDGGSAESLPYSPQGTASGASLDMWSWVQYPSVMRQVPDMSYICVSNNRLWGCKGDYIYASKLGDPTNFDVFDGLNTDSWQLEVEEKGDFTACIEYGGYPRFFKPDKMISVYGSLPSSFATQESGSMGIADGDSRSACVIGNTLFYLSPYGVCQYTGGTPQVISRPLGEDVIWKHGVAGGYGRYLVISMSDCAVARSTGLTEDTDKSFVWFRDEGNVFLKVTPDRSGNFDVHFDQRYCWILDGNGDKVFLPWSYLDSAPAIWDGMYERFQLFAYDMWQGVWHRWTNDYAWRYGDRCADIAVLENSIMALMTEQSGNSVYSLDGRLGTHTGQNRRPWSVTFARATSYYLNSATGSENKKGIVKLDVRLKKTGTESVNFYIRYDNGNWQCVHSLYRPIDNSIRIPLALRRCDHWQLAIDAYDPTTVLYSIAVSRYAGSDLYRAPEPQYN